MTGEPPMLSLMRGRSMMNFSCSTCHCVSVIYSFPSRICRLATSADQKTLIVNSWLPTPPLGRHLRHVTYSRSPFPYLLTRATLLLGINAKCKTMHTGTWHAAASLGIMRKCWLSGLWCPPLRCEAVAARPARCVSVLDVLPRTK